MIAPAMAVATASWIDFTNASTKTSSREQLGDIVERRRTTGRRDRADRDDQGREDQEQPDVGKERDDGEVVPRPAEPA